MVKTSLRQKITNEKGENLPETFLRHGRILKNNLETMLETTEKLNLEAMESPNLEAIENIGSL